MPDCLLNIDLGELPDEPEALYQLAHLANIACGGHAGDEHSIALAVANCRAHGTRVGAHPSYPDRENFGRTAMAIAPADLEASVFEQCARVARAAANASLPVEYVKPHGALYHAADRDPALADALARGAVRALGSTFALVGPAAGELARAAKRLGLAYAREGFADRGRRADGTLVPRNQPGALITDPSQAAAQCETLLRESAIETVCVHGDTPGATAIAAAVRAVIDARGR